MTETVSAGNRGRALVIGAGVSGLTTALCLRRAGYEVTIAAEKLAPDVVSVVAGALWEWPPAVCGHHSDQLSIDRSKEWCVRTYDIFSDLSQDPGTTGVYLRPVIFYFRYRLDERPTELAKMHELRDKVKGFRRDPALGEAHGVNPNYGVKDAYTHLAPMIDTDTYMSWLFSQVQAAGFQLVPGRIEGSILDREDELKDRFGADFIVNCAGLGAAELTGEAMFPLRGALVRVRNDGRTMPPITTAHCVPHDTEAHANEQDMVFIVPRGRDMLILGGLTEMNEWDLDIGLRNYGPVRDMLRRCRDFLPVLEQAVIDGDEPVRAGLRPFRYKNVRLEREPGTSIIHNYGHGGSGVTFSWGCAEEVVSLVSELVAEGRERVTVADDQSGELSDRILRYLQTQKTLTLATTTTTGLPHAATMLFVNDQTDLYFWSGPGSTTVRNIEQNPAVSVTIDHYTDDWAATKGIQASGDCVQLVDPADIERVVHAFSAKFQEVDRGAVESLLFFRITPSHLSFIDNESNGRAAQRTKKVGLDYRKHVAFSVFKDLPPRHAEAVAGQLETVRAGAGEVIVREGTAADAFFIIVDGEVEVAPEGGPGPIARLGPGQFFGEIAILRDTPRTATVRATVASTLLMMRRDDFKSLMAQSLATTHDFDQVVRERLAALSEGRVPNRT